MVLNIKWSLVVKREDSWDNSWGWDDDNNNTDSDFARSHRRELESQGNIQDLN